MNQTHAQAKPVADTTPVDLQPAPQARKPTDDDWALAQALYIAGASPRDIADKIGSTAAAVSTRSTRHNWPALRDRVKVSLTTLANPDRVNTLTKARDKFVSDMKDVVEQGAEFLKTNKPQTRKELQAHFRAARDVVEVAKPILGISSETAGSSSPLTLQFLVAPGQFARPVAGTDRSVETAA